MTTLVQTVATNGEIHDPGPGNRPIPSGVFGILLFIGTEVMFFAGLISAHLAISAGEGVWPPADQPRLPIEATALNTAVLLLSGVVLYLGGKAFVDPFRMRRAIKLTGLALLLGAFFVLFQGYEWVRLVGFGLTFTSSVYGALFYLIVGTHALHVTLAIALLSLCYFRLRSASRPREVAVLFQVSRIWWTFVVAIWPLLYVTVYLI